MPAEHVALHILDLPIRSARHRYDALPFALEEQVGQSLEQTHFAICDILPDGRILAAVVDTSVMDRIIADAPDKIILPEQILLSVPVKDADGAVWSAFRQGARILVRVSDGTGFVSDSSALCDVWRLSGMPRINSYGAALPGNITWTDRSFEGPGQANHLEKHDLRQGVYRPSSGIGRPLRWLAATVAIALLAHLALAFADMRAQTAMAEGLRGDAAELLETRFPSFSVDDSPSLLQQQMIAQAQPQIGSSFLPLMNRVSQTWLKHGTRIQINQLSWSDDALKLLVEASDLEALQQAEASLSADGLSVTSGSATAEAGSARAELVVRP
ncbi:MAG: type II secretion system protein GspL [Pelagibaca sp.]